MKEEYLNELARRITELANDPALDNLTHENYIVALWELLGYIATMELDEYAEGYFHNLLDRMEMLAKL